MSNWLVVLLAAPLASFGEAPGNARRDSATRPTRSALLGLAGAALGLDRADAQGQKDLSASFLTATRTILRGVPLTDFHTFQSLNASAGRVETRAQALAHPDKVETTLTKRDYRSDGLWQAAYWARPDAPISLNALAEAFHKPHFALWLGRKSCPLAHPLAAQLIAAEEASAAFAQHAHLLRQKGFAPHLFKASELALDDRLPTGAGNLPSRLHRRPDEPGDRMRWHFSRRAERLYEMPDMTGEST